MSIDKRKKFGFFIFAIFLFCYFFYLLDKNEILEIKQQGFKSFVYYGIIVFSFFSILFPIISFEKLKFKILFSILPIFVFIEILNFGIVRTVFVSSAWKTQYIYYQNKFDSSKKVEYQMMDIGAFGYRRRTVEVNYITEWFFISKEVGIYNSDWKKVTIEVNELKLK
nr:hypothetical protein [uncultured Flavobacterium sp.]